MKLSGITINKYRIFSHVQFSFAERFTLISGAHASGKTSLLDAVALTLGEFASAIGADPLLNAEPADVAAVGEWAGRPIQWGYRREAEGAVQHGGATQPGVKHIPRPDDAGRQAELPVFAYYSPCSNPNGWTAAAAPAADADLFFSSFTSYPEPVRTAVDRAMEAVASVAHRNAKFAFAGRASVSWRELSAGARRLAGLAADLAARCATLNPAQGGDAASQTPGVVLIDDIEAGLHPNRQRRLIEDLQNAFPRIQFIASTYSPFIIQSLAEGRLIDLDNNQPAEFPDLSIEDITETILGIPQPQRSKRYLDMRAAAAEYMSLLGKSQDGDPAEKQRLKRRLDELMAPFSTNQAFCAVLETERLESGIDDSGEDEEE